MLYQVLVNGTNILDYSDKSMVLLSPVVNIEIDVSGSFEFTLPPTHKYYDWFQPETIMEMTIEVYEDNILQWFGRPIEYHLDFYKNKKIYCEGALGFFNDSIIRSGEYEDVLLSDIFSTVISQHNAMVGANRQFTVGVFTVNNNPSYRKFNYEQTSDVLKSKFLDAVEGHFFLRRENGTNYIDFLKDMPYTCNQDVEFAENLLNFTYSFDGKDFATCVIPLGANNEETNEPITISSINNGSDVLVGPIASRYGKITKVQNYSDLKDPNELMTEGQKYLTTLQYNAFLIECSAVDLHSKIPSEQVFRVGQKVNCISNPHGINIELPISKMILYLDSAAKQITLGRIPKKTLSRFYKEQVGSNLRGFGEEIESDIPSGWEIVPPDEDGGEPTLKRVPVMIDITHLPLQINYTDTDKDFDPNGIEVKLVAKGLPDLEYFTDEWYPWSVVPTSELSYEIGGMGIPTSSISSGGDVPSKGQIMVWAIWRCAKSGCPYIGKSFRKAFYIHNTDAAAREAANGVDAIDHISIVIPPSKLEYYNGEHISLAGAKVVAYKADGSVFDGSGYTDGVIPLTELSLNPAVAHMEDGQRTYSAGGLPVAIIPVGTFFTGNAEGRTFTLGRAEGIVVAWKTRYTPTYPVEDITFHSLKPFALHTTTVTSSVFHTVEEGWLVANVIGDDARQYNQCLPGENGFLPLLERSPSWEDVHAALQELEGDPSKAEVKVNVAVDWTPYGGGTYSTSFGITIKEGGIYSGR